uniref:Uncharacterized protein n=1 Tax=Ananas comosus var. bracteatus TaxID=296719 RepID=A0A6V7P699_ANACO|nr:unnamed protein product [Ananas comosus var. bracteatus]
MSHSYNHQMEEVGHWQQHRNATPSLVVKKRVWISYPSPSMHALSLFKNPWVGDVQWRRASDAEVQRCCSDSANRFLAKPKASTVAAVAASSPLRSWWRLWIQEAKREHHRALSGSTGSSSRSSFPAYLREFLMLTAKILPALVSYEIADSGQEVRKELLGSKEKRSERNCERLCSEFYIRDEVCYALMNPCRD